MILSFYFFYMWLVHASVCIYVLYTHSRSFIASTAVWCECCKATSLNWGWWSLRQHFKGRATHLTSSYSSFPNIFYQSMVSDLKGIGATEHALSKSHICKWVTTKGHFSPRAGWYQVLKVLHIALHKACLQ